jgi:hypothetical protein
VRGAINELESVIRRYGIDEIVLSSPSVNGNVEHRIRDICAHLDRPVRRLYMEIR